MGFVNGIPRKLIKRVNEIEIDTHYYDNDVVPSNQDLFTYIVDEENIIATITGFAKNGVNVAIVPYRIKYGDQTSNMYATVKELENSAFSNYSSIESITLPNTIHVIPESLFEGCSNLHDCNIPRSINTIESKAYKDCTNLDTLFIGTNVKSIASDAFEGCNNLDIICYKGSYAETHAKAHNIPYSLISYVLDDDITKNSPNFVTSGTIYNRLAYLTNKDIGTIYKTGVYHIEIGNSNKCYLNDENNKTFKLYYENNKYVDITLSSNNYTKATLVVSCKETYANNKPNYVSNQYLLLTKIIDSKIYSEVWTNQLLYTYDSNNKTYNFSYYGYWSNNQSQLNSITENIKTSVIDSNTGTLNEVTAEDNSLVNKKYVDILVQSMNNQTESGVNYISGTLVGGQWNTISLGLSYNQSWKFISKPYVYTDNGISVDFRIKDTQVNQSTIINGFNTFKIYVPVDCNYLAGTIDGGSSTVVLDGYQMDYLVLKYYYTGTDGKDLDTVTAIENTNWNFKKTLGYGQGTDESGKYVIKNNNNNNILVQWGGDNTGGGTGNSEDKYYESLYFNINEIQNALDEDISIILYGTWYNSKINGKITIMLDCYTSSSVPSINVNNKIITLTSNDLVNTYSNNKLFQCSVDATSKTNSTYSTTYTPVCKLTFKKSVPNSNYRTISIEPLN